MLQKITKRAINPVWLFLLNQEICRDEDKRRISKMGINPYAQGGPAFYTSLGPTSTPGGFSGQSFGTPGLPFGFGFPSFGDPTFYFMPAASHFFMNRLLGFANGTAVNINFGPVPSHLGLGGLLLGLPFFGSSG